MSRFKIQGHIVPLIQGHFNTSYVSVQDIDPKEYNAIVQFQYILCVGSRSLVGFMLVGTLLVSIHPMCRFKGGDSMSCECSNTFQYILCVGSRKITLKEITKIARFQYILCVGSRVISHILLHI